MTETVRRWQIKAENDLKAGSDELLTAQPATDTVCFHMQQCVEKYLKAFLVSHGREVPRTHNLAVVVQACIEIDSDFTALREEGIDGMTDYAVAYRYPDDFYMPTVEECERAQAKALRIRDFVTRRLAGEDA